MQAQANADRLNALLYEIQNAKDRGDFNAACRLFEQVTRLAPNSPDYWCERGVTLRKCNRVDEALPCYDQALKLDPNHTFAWRSKGVALAGLNRMSEAFRCYEKALELDPSDSMTWNSLGVAYVRSENLHEAKRCYEKSLELNPRSLDTLVNLMGYYYRVNDQEGMLSTAQRIVAIQPNHPMAQSFLQQFGS
ncbi:MAG: tetratricopeptide repeat protein [Chloroflexi bacterium]|nr:tetratricopeptide repeat protein [Chloroflexota bacterium]